MISQQSETTIKQGITRKEWSDERIRESIESFIETAGRLPTTKELDLHPNLPPHTVIKNRYKISALKWLKENYREYIEDEVSRQKEQIKLFIEEYFRIKPYDSNEYDRCRIDTARSWQTISHYAESTSWTNLLDKLNLPRYSKHKCEIPKKVKVNIVLDEDFFEIPKYEKSTALKKRRENLPY